MSGHAHFRSWVSKRKAPLEGPGNSPLATSASPAGSDAKRLTKGSLAIAASARVERMKSKNAARRRAKRTDAAACEKNAVFLLTDTYHGCSLIHLKEYLFSYAQFPSSSLDAQVPSHAEAAADAIYKMIRTERNGPPNKVPMVKVQGVNGLRKWIKDKTNYAMVR